MGPRTFMLFFKMRQFFYFRKRENYKMAKLSDLSLKHRLFMKTYRYRSEEWSPAQMKKPLSGSRVAVVTTAALYGPDQEPFDESLRGGDFSYRIIPLDIDLNSLELGHRSSAFDPHGVEADKNLALPFDRLREFAKEGFIGEVNRRHLSFMGAITAPGRLLKQTAPEAVKLLKQDRVDVVLLTPV